MNTMKTVVSIAAIAFSGHALAQPGKTSGMTVAPAEKMMHMPAHAQAAKIEATKKADAAQQQGQEKAQLAHQHAAVKKQAAQVKVAEAQQHTVQAPVQLESKKEKMHSVVAPVPTVQPAKITPVQAETALQKQQTAVAQETVQQAAEQIKPASEQKTAQAEIKKEKKSWLNWFKKSA